MKISARNQLRGTVVAVTRGATTSHVVLDVNGTRLTAAIQDTITGASFLPNTSLNCRD